MMNKLVIAVIVVLMVLPTMAQSPDGFPTSTNTFDMPSDMCYSIVDQTPMIVSSSKGYGDYTFSYINISGDMVTNIWSHNGFSGNWWIDSTIKAKSHITPKCYQQ